VSVKKEEDEELAALGGTTRLVSRRKSNTPSSPTSSHGSYPSASPPPLFQTDQQAQHHGMYTMSPVNEWQQPVFPNSQSYNTATSPYASSSSLSPDPFFTSQIRTQQSLTLETMPEYYGYQNIPSLRSGYDNYQTYEHQQQMQVPPSSSNEFMTQNAMPDIQTSWLHLVSQYR
jgi:hypothetical protein